ncbi:hypothetical protein NDU88_006346 [Pleurodeles waltl]|uniref:Uncharacterized protein n=1 Tax=Pleurodeles waltl TaxID=8319 RepID=A0AAV7MYY2_PLEWA|nr:hypothetical protein NDU88_006346 [Pleurodeles waltl]
MHPAQATVPGRQRPGPLAARSSGRYVVVDSFVPVAPRRDQPGLTVPVPQGQPQDQRGPLSSPRSINPTGPARTTLPQEAAGLVRQRILAFPGAPLTISMTPQSSAAGGSRVPTSRPTADLTPQRRHQ